MTIVHIIFPYIRPECGNIPWNISSPMELCYGSVYCYAKYLSWQCVNSMNYIARNGMGLLVLDSNWGAAYYA